MAALTDNKYDVYNWIIKVINSCKDYHHFKATSKLVSNFDNKYGDWQMTGKLIGYESDKYFTIKN